MLILIIHLVFLLLFLFILGNPKDTDRHGFPWRRSFLFTTTTSSALLVGISESLSLFTILNQVYVATLWTFIGLIALLWGLQNGRLARGWRRVRSKKSREVVFFLLPSIVGGLGVFAYYYLASFQHDIHYLLGTSVNRLFMPVWVLGTLGLRAFYIPEDAKLEESETIKSGNPTDMD